MCAQPLRYSGDDASSGAGDDYDADDFENDPDLEVDGAALEMAQSNELGGKAAAATAAGAQGSTPSSARQSQQGGSPTASDSQGMSPQQSSPELGGLPAAMADSAVSSVSQIQAAAPQPRGSYTPEANRSRVSLAAEQSLPQPPPIAALPHGQAPAVLAPATTSSVSFAVQGAASPVSPSLGLPPLNPTISPYIDRSGAQGLLAFSSGGGLQYGMPYGHLQPAANPITIVSHVQPSSPAAQSPPMMQQQLLDSQHAPSAGSPSVLTASPPPQQALIDAAALAAAQEASQQQQQRLAVAIRQSVEYSRLADQTHTLQARLEALTQQLLHAGRARDAAEAALLEQNQRMQDSEKRLHAQYEAKLLEKQKEIQQLRTKVQQLDAQGIKGRLGGGNARGSAASGLPSISPEEAATLRKEMAEQEMLIKGYQQENEQAVRRIKDLEESVARAEERAAEESLRLERQVLLAQDDHGRRNAETAAKLNRVLQLEQEVAAVKEQAETRQAELRSQLDKVRAEKKELEARAAGVDLRAMAKGDVLVGQLKQEMEAGKAATQKLVTEMQEKLRWYAENQDLLNRNDQLVAEQRGVIQNLHARLAVYEGPDGRPAAKGGSVSSASSAPAARVRELEAQVDQLSKALRSRAPANSLAAVIAAAKPSAEETQLVNGLRARVEDLEEELRTKDESFELQLRTYQQQFEKLKAQYAERASRLEAATKVKGRVKDLERQIEDQKGIFSRRIRELEAKLKAAQDVVIAHGATIPPTPAPTAAVPASALHTPTKALAVAGGGHGPADTHVQHHAASGPVHGRKDDVVPGPALRAREAEVKKLQAELERRSKQVSELHLKLGEAESKILRLARVADARKSQPGLSPLQNRSAYGGNHDDQPVGPSNGSNAVQAAMAAEQLRELQERCASLTAENNALRQQSTQLTRQVASLRQELEAARSAAAQVPANDSIVADLRRRLEAADMALTTVQRSATDAVERAAMSTSEHQRNMLRLHDEVAYKEGLKWQERLATLEQELRSSQQRCEQLEGELAVVRARAVGSWAPEAAQFVALERRLAELEREQVAREAKWRAVLKDTRSLYDMQSDTERRRWESTLAAKESEVQATRMELEALLREAQEVQVLQARVAAASTRGPSRVAAQR